MMLILAVYKVVVTSEPSVHLSLSITHLQPSVRASKREIRRSGVRLFSSQACDKTKKKFFIFHWVSYCFFYSLHIPTAQLSAWWRMKWCWSIGERLKQEQVHWSILSLVSLPDCDWHWKWPHRESSDSISLPRLDYNSLLTTCNKFLVQQPFDYI